MTSLYSVGAMVRKGDYSVATQDPDEQTRAKDYSFAACIASLLVFLALCIIIFLAAYPWASSKQVTLNQKLNSLIVVTTSLSKKISFLYSLVYFFQTINFGPLVKWI
jgi:hypothetical protein